MQIEHNNYQYDDPIKREVLDDAYKPKRTSEPTETELCETVVLLKRIMPHRSLERAISMLYQTLIKRKSPSEVFPEPIPINYGQSMPSQFNKTVNNSDGISRTYSKDELLKTKFPNDQDQFKYKEKRLVAKSFVAKGYGHEHANIQLSKAKFTHSLTKEVYKPLISTVITQAFRRLQSFLIEDCHKKISPIMKQEMKKAMKPLLSSTALGQSNVSIFKKYLRLIFGLSAVTLTETQSQNLYLAVIKQIFEKQFTMQQLEAGIVDQERHNSDGKNQISETNLNENRKEDSLKEKVEDNMNEKAECVERISQDDEKFIECYLKYGSLSKILDEGTLLIRLNTHAKMKKRLFELLSLSIRRIKMELSREAGSVEFPKISQRQINTILRSNEGGVLRSYLLEYYRSQGYEALRIHKIVNGLKELMRKDLVQDEACNSLVGEDQQFYQIKIQQQQDIKIEQPRLQ